MNERPAAGGALEVTTRAGSHFEHTASMTTITTTMIDNRAALREMLHQIDLDEQLRRRAVQQAILTASARWCVRRAEQWDQARPRPGDFIGNASPGELAEADRRCAETVQACLNGAALMEWEAGDDD